MNVPFNALHQVNLDLAEAKNIIRKTVADNKEIFASYKKAKKLLDDDVAYLHSIELVRNQLQQEDQSDLRRSAIDTKINQINQFNWAKYLDCSVSLDTPHQLIHILYGSIVSADTYNPYTNQRQLHIRINEHTSAQELLIAKTILENVKECPINSTDRHFDPSFTISREWSLDRISYIDNQWFFINMENEEKLSFKSLDHLLKALRRTSKNLS